MNSRGMRAASYRAGICRRASSDAGNGRPASCGSAVPSLAAAWVASGPRKRRRPAAGGRRRRRSYPSTARRSPTPPPRAGPAARSNAVRRAVGIPPGAGPPRPRAPSPSTLDETGADHVDADTLGGIVQRGHLGQSELAVLGRGVGRGRGEADSPLVLQGVATSTSAAFATSVRTKAASPPPWLKRVLEQCSPPGNANEE